MFVATSWEEFATTSGKNAKRRRADFHPGRVERIAAGSGRKENEVKELLQKFAQMRQMMVQLGASTGLMGKIPGFKQFQQMKRSRTWIRHRSWAPVAQARCSAKAPACRTCPQCRASCPEHPGLAEGYTPPGTKGLVGPSRRNDKQKARDKRKAEKAARKKNRR